MKPLLILVDLQQDYLKSADFEPSLGRALNGAVSSNFPLPHARH